MKRLKLARGRRLNDIDKADNGEENRHRRPREIKNRNPDERNRIKHPFISRYATVVLYAERLLGDFAKTDSRERKPKTGDYLPSKPKVRERVRERDTWQATERSGSERNEKPDPETCRYEKAEFLSERSHFDETPIL